MYMMPQKQDWALKDRRITSKEKMSIWIEKKPITCDICVYMCAKNQKNFNFCQKQIQYTSDQKF